MQAHQKMALQIEVNTNTSGYRRTSGTLPAAAIPSQFPAGHSPPEMACHQTRRQHGRTGDGEIPSDEGPAQPRQRCQGGPGQPKDCQYPRQKMGAPHRIRNRWGAVHGSENTGQGRKGGPLPVQKRLKTREPLVPPKPKLFFNAMSIFMSRAVLAQ
jgi:hypothetical protein